jgi:hypothetical protein
MIHVEFNPKKPCPMCGSPIIWREPERGIFAIETDFMAEEPSENGFSINGFDDRVRYACGSEHEINKKFGQTDRCRARVERGKL